MTFTAFQQQVFAVISAIQDSFETHPPTAELHAPADWAELRSTVRRVAEELILCADVRSAVAKLREDHAALLGVVWLASEIPDDSVRVVLERAHAATVHETSALPLHPFCAYIIELCDGLELVRATPKT